MRAVMGEIDEIAARAALEAVERGTDPAEAALPLGVSR
jgi:hypothetical protein